MRELDWTAVALVASLLVVAALVNWRARAQRARLKRAVVVASAFAIAVVARELVAAATTSDAWYRPADSIADALAAFAFVNLGGLVVFFVALPAMRLALPSIVRDLATAIAYVVALVVVLSRHGMNPTSAIATAGVASAVLAISLQQTLGNILGGMALQLDGSIDEGDWLQFPDGKQGQVKAIRWRHTLVETRDWSTIVVPNSQLLATNITILGKRGGTRTSTRCWIYFNVDFRYPPQRVCRVVNEALAASPMKNVATNPVANAVCMDLARDSFAYYGVRYWAIDMWNNDATSSIVRTRAFNALRRAGIPLAVPAHTDLLEVQNPRRRERRDLRDRDANFAAARTVSLFASLTEEELRVLAGGMSAALYAQDELITRQGAAAHWLYILTSGRVEVRTHVDIDGDGPAPDRVRAVATLEAPAFFGEMSLMTGEPRRADVIALGDVECLRLGRATFERVIHDRPEIAEEVSTILARRQVELAAVREGLSEEARRARESIERERILTGIRAFFGL